MTMGSKIIHNQAQARKENHT